MVSKGLGQVTKQKIICGDCLERLQEVKEHSIDMIFADLPYGTTHNAWDNKIPLGKLWRELKRVIKPASPILLFSQQPFTADLINSNREWFRYEWIWQKTLGTGFLNANRMPLRAHENILVFYEHLPTYNPQKTKRDKTIYVGASNSVTKNYSEYKPTAYKSDYKYPTDVIKFANPSYTSTHVHSTQKPLDLLQYLIKTYTNEWDTVLDPTCGSGSCGVACKLTNRNFIGIEKEQKFYESAVRWLDATKNN